MQFSILTIFALAALTVSANPYDGLYDLSPRDLENHIIAREAYIETFDKYRRNMIERRLALPKGGGGGGKGGGKPKTPPKDKNNNNSNGGGIQPCPPGFSADGKKGRSSPQLDIYLSHADQRLSADSLGCLPKSFERPWRLQRHDWPLCSGWLQSGEGEHHEAVREQGGPGLSEEGGLQKGSDLEVLQVRHLILIEWRGVLRRKAIPEFELDESTSMVNHPVPRPPLPFLLPLRLSPPLPDPCISSTSLLLSFNVPPLKVPIPGASTPLSLLRFTPPFFFTSFSRMIPFSFASRLLTSSFTIALASIPFLCDMGIFSCLKREDLAPSDCK